MSANGDGLPSQVLSELGKTQPNTLEISQMYGYKIILFAIFSHVKKYNIQGQRRMKVDAI
jgi:hypothetical protein